ncbi:MAG: hypothetical protein AAAB35_13730 [Phyllobacterium sp.]|uniref:hypothetical protein n=1 Tax=Phyllobacterium sp. TaxID=1871046 RepID=UPI0030F35512
MDFIERWFGVSPDGGDGSTEMLYLCVAVVIIGVIVARRHIAKIANYWRNRKID